MMHNSSKLKKKIRTNDALEKKKKRTMHVAVGFRDGLGVHV
jgi:hypothetical protein